MKLNIGCMRVLRRAIDKEACRTYCTQRAEKLTNAEIRKKRNEIFQEEKKRQFSLVTRIEKIEVQHKGPPEDCTLYMNKNLSTPFNCAMHISELLMNRSVCALVNGKIWDIHRPLEEDCELRFLHFKDEDPMEVNKAFWRSCSFITGHVLETAFKDSHRVDLCSFPPPDIESGSFVYDAHLPLEGWKPSTEELMCMSRIGWKLHGEDLKFECLEVNATVATKMFEDNPFKSQQISSIAAKSHNKSTVTLYKMGNHIDISSGPMIATTAMIGRFSIVAIHDFASPRYGPLKRIQGVAIPTQLSMHYWTYEQLLKRGRKFNRCKPLPRNNNNNNNKNNKAVQT